MTFMIGGAWKSHDREQLVGDDRVGCARGGAAALMLRATTRAVLAVPRRWAPLFDQRVCVRGDLSEPLIRTGTVMRSSCPRIVTSMRPRSCRSRLISS